MSGLNISFRIQAIDDFSATMKDLNKETKKAFESVGQIGTAFTAAGAGIAVGLGYAVKTASDFNAQMSRVSAISGATGAQLEELRKAALDLGASTSKSASEVAIGMEEMAKKGFEVNEVLAAMPGIIAASEASGEDLARVSEVVASALNSFHMEASEASRIADVMAMAANKSSADVNDLGYAFKYAAPLANTLGISMETLAAATGIMTDAGMRGEQAGTTLRMALIRLSDPPKEAAKEINKLGLKVADANGNMLPFDQIVQQLSESTKGMGNAAKLAALSQIFGAEAASGMLTIIDAGPDKLRKFTSELENAEGSAKKTAKAMKDNLKGAAEELFGAFETLLITVGTALTPAIQALTVALTKLVNWFNGLPKSVQTTIAVVAALTAVFLLILGPILLLVALIPSITAGFAALAGAMGIATSTLLIGIGAVLGIVGAIIALGVALVVAYKKVDWFRDMVNSAINSIKDVVAKGLQAVKTYFQKELSEVKKFWEENGAEIMEVVRFAMAYLSAVIRTQMAVIKGVFMAVWPILKATVMLTWNAIKFVISNTLDFILGMIKFWSKLLNGDWRGALDALKETAKNIMGNIVNFFKGINLREIGRDIIRGLISGIKSMAGDVGKSVASIAKSIPSGVKKMLDIHSPSRVMMSLGGYTAEGLALGIGKGIGGIQQMAGAMANAAVPNVNGPSLSYGMASASNNGASTSASASDTFNFEGMFAGAQFTVRNDNDVKAIAREIYNMTQNAKARRGIK